MRFVLALLAVLLAVPAQAQVSDLSLAQTFPVTGVPANKLVYGVQEFPFNVGGRTPDSGNAWVTLNNQAYGYLVTGSVAPVWVASMGASLDNSNGALADDQAWSTAMLAYMTGSGNSQPTVWNTADKSASINIGAGGLSATSTVGFAFGTGTASVRGTTAKSTGKACFEAALTAATNSWNLGLANTNFDLAQPIGLGTGADGVGFEPGGVGGNGNSIFFNTAALSNGTIQSPSGDAATICVDLGANLIWATSGTMRGQGFPWNNSATANPATGAGGLSIAGIGGPLFIIFNEGDAGGVSTLNTAGPFAVATPATFSAWDATNGPSFSGCQQPMGMAWENWGSHAGFNPNGNLNPDGTMKAGQLAVWSQLLYTPACAPITGTAWNPGDKSTSIALSGNNLVATSGTTFANGAGSASVRSTTSKSAGKACFDVQMSAATNNWNVGLANASFNLDDLIGLGTGPNGVGIEPGATPTGGNSIFFNSALLSAGSITSSAPDPVTVCEDFGAGLIWMTSAAMRSQGNTWNNSPAANPATGTGGLSTSGLTCPCFIIYNNVQSGGVATLNVAGPLAVATPGGFVTWDVVVPNTTKRPLLINLGAIANDKLMFASAHEHPDR